MERLAVLRWMRGWRCPTSPTERILRKEVIREWFNWKSSRPVERLRILYGTRGDRRRRPRHRQTECLLLNCCHNAGRFPEDFMFRLSVDEWENLKCQNGISSYGKE